MNEWMNDVWHQKRNVLQMSVFQLSTNVHTVSLLIAFVFIGYVGLEDTTSCTRHSYANKYKYEGCFRTQCREASFTKCKNALFVIVTYPLIS
jgi:hypothetical protein